MNGQKCTLFSALSHLLEIEKLWQKSNPYKSSNIECLLIFKNFDIFQEKEEIR